MSDFQRLRVRLLTGLGMGMAALLPHCGGTSSDGSGSDGSGSTGSGSTTSGSGGQGTGGSLSVGGASAGSTTTGQGGATSGGSGGVGASGGVSTGGANTGVGGTYIPMCPEPTTDCRSPEQITSCFEMKDAGAPFAGDGGAGDGSSCPEPYEMSGCVAGTPLSEPPTVQDGACCYQVQPFCGVGRPFTVHGAARTAQAVSRGDWRAAVDLVEEPAQLGAELARAWLEDALLEHASIASFARLTLELLAVGAPPDLVAGAQRASLDEIRHAEICFALASQHSESAQGPGRLDLDAALGAVDLVRLAVSTVEEGCVGETLGALLVAEQARQAADPRLQALLAEIAEDEARHAELSWCIVRWAIERGGEPVRAAVEGAFAEALASFEARRFEPTPAASDWNRAGRLSAQQSAEITARALREVIAPCVAALISQGPARTATDPVLTSLS